MINEIKEKLTKKTPLICVSTQLIEAGVDIDFGAVIRYLAGLDSIVQAAGRCNRQGVRTTLGTVTVLNPIKENLERLKDIQIGKNITERVWQEFSTHPEDFENDRIGITAVAQYYRYYFFERKREMSYHISKDSFLGVEDNIFSLLSTNENSCQEYYRKNQQSIDIQFKQAFQSAAKCFRVIDRNYSRNRK